MNRTSVKQTLSVETLQSFYRKGYRAFPIAQPFPASEYSRKDKPNLPRFNGKNPSFLKAGKPTEIKHSHYYESDPSEAEQRAWGNDWYGIGLMCGVNDLAVIDIDRKHFDSDESCKAFYSRCMEATGGLGETTPSGGFHVFVKLLEGNGGNIYDRLTGKQVGELLARHSNGKAFCVVSPSPGYQGADLPNVSELPVIDLSNLPFCFKAEASTQIEYQSKVSSSNDAKAFTVHLTALATAKNQAFLQNPFIDEEEDGSEIITRVGRDLLGIERKCSNEGINFYQPAFDLLIEAGEAVGYDQSRIERIYKSFCNKTCSPGILWGQKDDSRWTSRIKKLKTGLIEKSSNDSIAIAWEPGMYLLANVKNILKSEINDWVFVLNQYHKFNGKFYESFEACHLESLVQDGLASFTVLRYAKDGSAITTKPFATTRAVKEAIAYFTMKIARPFTEIYKDGLCLANGVLVWDYSEKVPQPILKPHSKDYLFLSGSTVSYNPEADDTYCLQLLECIEPSQRQVWLEHMSLNFSVKRCLEKFGRLRAAFHEGDGNNGKDTCKDAIGDIFGCLGSFALEDFKRYQEGNRFGLASLPKFSLSWASENDHKCKIDNLQSLKIAIVMNGKLASEFKGKDQVEFTPQCLFHFNVNKAPITSGTSEFVKSRFAIFRYPFTFTQDGRLGTLKADPRFAYDTQWRIQNVSSALLNKLIEAYQAIWERGTLEYGTTTERLQEWAKDNNHILRFASESGLVEAPGNLIPVSEVWEKLREWYRAEEILIKDEFGMNEAYVSDADQFDKWVKQNQQLFDRLKEFFPKIERHRTKSGRMIKGLTFVEPASSSENDLDTDVKQNPEKYEALHQTIEDRPISQAIAIAKKQEILIEELVLDTCAAVKSCFQDELPNLMKRIVIYPQEIKQEYWKRLKAHLEQTETSNNSKSILKQVKKYGQEAKQ
jgi:phage/plasmid-associated DNA primase